MISSCRLNEVKTSYKFQKLLIFEMMVVVAAAAMCGGRFASF